MQHRLSGVYEYSFKQGGRKYIGSSINLSKRHRDHIYSLKNNTHPNKDFQKDYNLYGIENLLYTILEIVDNLELLLKKNSFKEFKNYLFSKEQFYLDIHGAQDFLHNKDYRFFKLLYNKSVIAKGTKNKNYENIEKEIFQYKDGKLINRFCNSVMAELSTGINSSSIRRCYQGIRKTAGGYNWSNILIDKHPITRRKDEKEILQYSKEGELLNSFKSIAEAMRNTSINIRKGKSNHFSSYGGYYWLFKDEIFEEFIKNKKK